MKKLIITGMICLVLASCGTKELSRKEVLQILKQEVQYPKVIDYEVFCADPQHAQKVIEAGLEKEGLLTVQKTQKLKDVGKPLITFTEKAQQYLLTTPKDDKSLDVQKVKIAEEVLMEVTGIKQDTKSAVVEYKTVYKNVTPFASLVNSDFKQNPTRTAHFSLYDDGWRMEKN